MLEKVTMMSLVMELTVRRSCDNVITYYCLLVLTCIEDGTPRRQGGQGDLLSGSIGVLLYWARLAESKYAIILFVYLVITSSTHPSTHGSIFPHVFSPSIDLSVHSFIYPSTHIHLLVNIALSLSLSLSH